MHRYNFANFMGRYSSTSVEDMPMVQMAKKLGVSQTQGTWLAGGSVRNTLLQRPLDSDYDVFFEDDVSADKCRCKLIGLGATLAHQNEFNETWDLAGEKIQLILLYRQSLEECLGSFDFTICQTGFDGVDLVVGEHTLWDLQRKVLVPLTLTYPAATIRRMIKYTQQGFYACQGCITEILRQVVENPGTLNLEVLYLD